MRIGAGKTTTVRILAGRASPPSGMASALGGAPRQNPAFLAEIGFLAQEIPLYRRFTAEDHIRIGAHMNPRWDAPLARAWLTELRIPLDQRVGTLSGGQRAQVALALAKRPRVLLLDEPVAALDPLVRRNLTAGAGSSPISPPAATGRSRASRPGSTCCWRRRLSRSRSSSSAGGTHSEPPATTPGSAVRRVR